MAKFTKDYRKAISVKQREAVSRAFKVEATFHLLNGDDVTCQVVDAVGYDQDVIATLIVKNEIVISRLVGVNGGLTCF